MGGGGGAVPNAALSARPAVYSPPCFIGVAKTEGEPAGPSLTHTKDVKAGSWGGGGGGGGTGSIGGGGGMKRKHPR